MANRVITIIVTYNRSSLLKRAIESVLGQSRPPDEVVVIDNASTDDTEAVLSAFGERISVIRLGFNLGGAGGFHIGMLEGCARGADYLWLMDDDGVPDPDCLETLLLAQERANIDMCGPLVVAEDDAERLAFQLGSGFDGVPNHLTVEEAKAAAVGGLVMNALCPFNGVLVRSSVVQKIGPTKAEMFVWGDEVDFTARMHRNDMRIATVTDAVHRHPKSRKSLEKILFKRDPKFFPPRGREVFHYRNLGYLTARDRGYLQSLFGMFRSTALMVLRGMPRTAAIVPLWWLDGMFDIYSLAPSKKTLLDRLNTEKRRIGLDV